MMMMQKQNIDTNHKVLCHTWEKVLDRFDHSFEMAPLLGGIEPGSITLQTITDILQILATMTGFGPGIELITCMSLANTNIQDSDLKHHNCPKL